MLRFIEISVWHLGANGNWCSTPITNRSYTPLPVTVETNLVYLNGELKEGLIWDTALVENLLEPFVGENSFGEAMYQSVNEEQVLHGHYIVDAGETHNATIVTWRVASYIITEVEPASLPQPHSPEPPAPALQPTGDVRYEKAFNRSNDTWRVTKLTLDEEGNWTRDHIATLDTESLADLLIAVCSGITIFVSTEAGLVQAVTVPPILLHRINAEVIDFDILSSDPSDICGGVSFTNEDGERVVCSVLPTTVRCPNGADAVDRAIEASRC